MWACTRHSRICTVWETGELAVVQGVGYPDPNRSHFRSMEIWQTGTVGPAPPAGWLGRLGDAHPPLELCHVGQGSMPLAMQGRKVVAQSLASVAAYYPGKKDHHKRVTTERPHPTGGAPHPAGVGPPPGRTRKGEVDSDSLFRVFRWIPWLISDFRDLYASLIRRWLDVDPTPILGERKATMILVSTRASARRGRTITTTRGAKRESRSAQFSRRV